MNKKTRIPISILIGFILWFFGTYGIGEFWNNVDWVFTKELVIIPCSVIWGICIFLIIGFLYIE